MCRHLASISKVCCPHSCLHPSGLNLSGSELHHREKDKDSPDAKRAAGVFSANPWWKNIYSDVRHSCPLARGFVLISPVLHNTKESASAWDRPGHNLHICLHQYSNLPFLVKVAMSEGWCRLQESSLQAHLRCSCSRRTSPRKKC